MKAEHQIAARRPAIDVARVLALLLVVAGHLTLAVIDRPGGKLRGENLLTLYPRWSWLAALAPMPVFFAAAGWANARATAAQAAGRLRPLMTVASVVVLAWSTAVVLTSAVTGHGGIAGQGARIATQPLWFIAAYAPLAASGRWLATLARTHPVRTIGACLVALGALDLARFRYGAQPWIGWPGFFLAWGTPWLLGAWWRARCEGRSFSERKVGAVLLVAGALAGLALVRYCGYAASLISVSPGGRSNTTPPNLYTAVAGSAQFGGLLLLAGLLDRFGTRWAATFRRAGEAAVGVYLCHLSALALCVGFMAAGFPAPVRLSVTWWLTRPLWWAAVLGVTGGAVGAIAFMRRRWQRDRIPRQPIGVGGRSWVILAVVLTGLAGGFIGLKGPNTVVRALVCSGLVVAADVALATAVRFGDG